MGADGTSAATGSPGAGRGAAVQVTGLTHRFGGPPPLEVLAGVDLAAAPVALNDGYVARTMIDGRKVNVAVAAEV